MAKLLTGTRVYGTANVDNVLTVGNITPVNSTSNTTGSLIVVGGVGILGNTYTGNLVISGSSAAGNGITFADGTKQTTAASGSGIDQYARDTANVTIGVNTTQNTRITIIEGTNASQNVRIDYSNTAITIIQGTDVGQNSRMTIIEGVDVGQNTRMTIGDGVNTSQNTRIDYSNTAITIIQGTDVSQNTRIDYSNTAITILQGVNAGQNSNIAFVQTLANTDFTNVSIATTTSSSNGLYIPVITVAANGRVTAISNTLITTSGGGSVSGYLNNSVIFANTTGYLSNTSNISFYTSNNTLVINGTLAATSKSFSINHPTKPNTQLRYGSLEGPENGVYVRGVLNGNVIELPEYWTKLVDPKTITVQLTPIGKHQKLYVDRVEDNCVFVGVDGWFKNNITCYYIIYAERADIEKLVVEI